MVSGVSGTGHCSQLGCNVLVSEATPGTNKQQPQTDKKEQKRREKRKSVLKQPLYIPLTN